MSKDFYLGIETATTNCSVALYEGSELLGWKETNSGYSHSENLALHVQELLANAQIKVFDLAGIGVGVGPGSYTGLRIGVSFVKGLAMKHQVPIVRFTSTELLLRQFMAEDVEVNQKDIIIPMIDARRMEVYCQVFDGTGHALSDVFAEELTEASYSTYINGADRVFILGPGSGKFTQVFSGGKLQHIPDHYPSALGMKSALVDKVEAEQWEDVAYFEPFYLKEFVAGKPKKVILRPE